jgi:hypothetical protein
VKKGRAWVWGSFGKQPSTWAFWVSTSQPRVPGVQDAVGRAASITDVNNCLNTDRTILQTTNRR